MEKIKLKGGSLSGVYLIKDDKKTYVRKEVSVLHNREYGFQRWYSQLKKIQRYNSLFPNLFPELLSYGLEDDIAYFDMEYLENAISAHKFVCSTTDPKKIEIFLENLLSSMNRLHSVKLKSNTNSLDLYIKEEVLQKLNDAIIDDIFLQFVKHKTVNVNGYDIKAFYYEVDNYTSLFKKVYNNPVECFTHGNITLENLLYDEENDKLYFIDPYEENIIDSSLTEYSQIFQSTNSKYEIYNNLDIDVVNNNLIINNVDNFGVDYLNKLFDDHLRKTISNDQYISVKLFEVSQFVRMLPFKKEIDKNKMLFFYILASKLFNDVKILL